MDRMKMNRLAPRWVSMGNSPPRTASDRLLPRDKVPAAHGQA